MLSPRYLLQRKGKGRYERKSSLSLGHHLTIRPGARMQRVIKELKPWVVHGAARQTPRFWCTSKCHPPGEGGLAVTHPVQDTPRGPPRAETAPRMLSPLVGFAFTTLLLLLDLSIALSCSSGQYAGAIPNGKAARLCRRYPK